MIDMRSTATRPQRARVVVAMLLLALISLPALAGPVAAQDESAAPAASPTAAEQACASADDLRLILEFTAESLESESGLVPVGIGVIAGLSEARTLAGLVAETYRPLVDDLIVSLQDLRDSLGDLDELDTAGSKLATVGESIVEIGNAMDSLAVQLQTGCDSE